MAGYHFDKELFKTNFKAKDSSTKSLDSARLNHVPDKCFKLFPYKAANRNQNLISIYLLIHYLVIKNIVI